jgi:hypothetical protein
VDDNTADLLALVADSDDTDLEWDEFAKALAYAAMKDGGEVRPNTLRPLVRGIVSPKRIGAFTSKAKAEGLIADAGQWETSDDREGRNGGRPMRVYVYLGGAA